MSKQAEDDDICVTGQGPNGARVVIVTRFPVGPKSQSELIGYMEEAGWNTDRLMWCSAIKCRVWDLEPNKTDMKACRPYLDQELSFLEPEYVLCIGGEALFAATGKSGIMKYRGHLFTHASSATVMATIAPGMVARNPGFRDGFIADLRYFDSLVRGVSVNRDPYHLPTPDRVVDVTSKDALRSLVTVLNASGVVAFDVETTGRSERDQGAAIVSLALTTAVADMNTAMVWRIPLFHPGSVWRRQWQRILAIIGKALCKVKRRIAHNAKFDSRWLRQFGVPMTPTFDTIVATAILDENRVKGLKPLAQQLLGADPWGIDTKNLLNTPIDEVLEYNGLDTWHDLRLYYVFRAELIRQPRIGKLFVHLMMPLVQELIAVEQRGVYVDQQILATNTHIAKTTLTDIKSRLMEWVPPRDEWPTNIKDVNFNASNFARWWLFDHLKLPILARGKRKDDGSPGMPSMAEAVMLELAEIHDVGKLMGEHALWQKRITGFFEPYGDVLDDESRIHTIFKPWGTVTGRLSSGKEDEEKVTAKVDRGKGVNLQQVPRDILLRGVFGAPPGSSFVEADYSQIELRIAAFLAREQTMLHLYATGQDIHMAMAMRMTGKPTSAVTKEERKRAKAVNFGFLYGMGPAKFISTAWLNYQVRVTEEESRAFRKSFFDQFPGLPPWHNRQRRLAHKYGRVSTPMGRVRHLPDITSPLPEVQGEAERQAINSPVQGMASDMAALAMVLVSRKLRRRGLTAHAIGTVHDAVNFEIPDTELREALPIIKDTMENLPLERLFGVVLDVPIIADIKVGTHWGGARELSVDEIYDWQGVAA